MAYIIVLFLSFCGFNLWGEEPPETKNLQKVIIAQAEFGKSLSHLHPLKIEAGLNLALMLSGRYKLITAKEKDSCYKELLKKKKDVTIVELSKAVNADLMVFVKVNAFVNMLRAEVVSVPVSNPEIKNRGVGYALIKYYKGDTDEVVYDPTILRALQRAFAGSVKDTNLFQSCEGEYKVKPVPTLVIGSLHYINDDAYPLWELFQNEVVNSFDAVESMFEQALLSPNYECYDLATRDSIYSMFNMYIPENYNPPTIYEVNSLSKMEVDYYITGEFKRIRTGAFIELRLCKIETFQLDIQKTVNSFLEKDDKENFRKILKKLVSELLDG